ncbi:MAG: tripartite tricarboxylate transporter TctB family protein [Candidatus Pacebacteria bacterium]|nr:tripartite tricarboxylate transporter TctB family protein [Candidatus Paceibacterota bacterium]
MKRQNIIYSAVLIAIGMFAFVYAGRYTTTSAQYVTTAALFPRIMAVGLIVTAITTLIQSLVHKADEATSARKGDVVKFLLSAGIFIAYFLLFKPLGFIVDSALLVFICMYRLGCRKWWTMLIYSIVMPSLIFALFYYVFYTNLPLGVLSGILPRY